MPSAARRSSSCSAALRLKASMRIAEGSAPRSTSSTTRLIRVLVLPEPAGASTRAGPQWCSTAARWAFVQADRVRAARGPASRRRRGGRRTPDGRRAAPCSRGPQQAADVFEVEPRGSAHGERARLEDLRGEREAQAERKAAREQGVDEAQEDLGRLRLELLARPPPPPRPVAGSPRSRERRSSPGSSVQTRREAKRVPGAAAVASRARSLREATSEEEPWRADRRRAGPCGSGVGRSTHGRTTLAARRGRDEGDEGGRCRADLRRARRTARSRTG